MKLQVHLIQHSQARSPNGMAETFQTAVDLTGDLAVTIEDPIHHIAPGPTPFGKVQIHKGNQLRDGKTVVNLHHTDLFFGIADTRFLICFGDALAGRNEMVTVPIVIAHFLTAAQRQLQTFDGDDVSFAQLFG